MHIAHPETDFEKTVNTTRRTISWPLHTTKPTEKYARQSEMSSRNIECNLFTTNWKLGPLLLLQVSIGMEIRGSEGVKA